MTIFYCKIYGPNTRQLDKPTWVRGDFELVDIHRMVATINADNLARSRSYSSRGIAGRGPAMKATTRDRNDIRCRFCSRVGHVKIKFPLRIKQ